MLDNQRPAAVAFDLDGLMFNTEELYVEVATELLRRRGKQFTKELVDQMMGRQSQIALQIMIDWHGLDATVPQLVAETDEMFPSILDRRLAPMQGLLDLLAALERVDLPKAVTTSSRRSFVNDVLGRFRFESRFAFTLCAEDITKGKPHPEIYLTAAERFGCAPARLLVLEDSENGCRAAVAAGAITVAVPAGHSVRHDFRGTSLVADTLADPRLYELLGIAPNPTGFPR